jgi:DNA (cytosine-5)-methyltransferase 1
MKRIKGSKRGLTFSLDDDSIIGTKYRYIIDQDKKEIVIISDKKGNMTVSRKRSGKGFKPLYDIRSKEVKKLVSASDYMEIEVSGEMIIVHTYVKTRMKLQKRKIVYLEEILGKKTGEIILDAAVGAEDIFHQMSIFEFLKEHEMSLEKTKEFSKIYDVISLFSGAGLLDYAFRDPKIRFVYGIDFDKDACMTYRENIGSHIECRDIRKVTSNEMPSADIIIGGPCCQGYSNANRHNLESEEAKAKRLLIDDYIRLVKEKQPFVFVIENVPQFFTKDNGIYIRKVMEGLSDYEITTTTIIDSHVGGFTSRKRAIVIGSKVGKIILPSETIHSVKNVREALSQVDENWFNYNDVTMPRERTKLTMSYVPQGGNWKDIPEQIHKFGPATQSNTYRRLAWNEISPTIVNWRKCNLIHPEKNRTLTVSEAAALMGLDKKFKVLGNSLNSKQQQIGNGITQAIGRFIKKHVIKALDAFFVDQPVTI